jgi:hypothetical protein
MESLNQAEFGPSEHSQESVIYRSLDDQKNSVEPGSNKTNRKIMIDMLSRQDKITVKISEIVEINAQIGEIRHGMYSDFCIFYCCATSIIGGLIGCRSNHLDNLKVMELKRQKYDLKRELKELLIFSNNK